MSDAADQVPSAPPSLLGLAEFAAHARMTPARVRGLLKDRAVVGVRRDGDVVIPAEFTDDGEVLRGLPGTITLLTDAGYDDSEIVAWLFTSGASGSPIDRLRAGQVTAVHRLAQISGF